jgi:hypothetical protein
MTRASAARRSRMGARERTLRTIGPAEVRSGSEIRPKTDKG